MMRLEYRFRNISAETEMNHDTEAAQNITFKVIACDPAG